MGFYWQAGADVPVFNKCPDYAFEFTFEFIKERTSMELAEQTPFCKRIKSAQPSYWICLVRRFLIHLEKGPLYELKEFGQGLLGYKKEHLVEGARNV